MAGRQALTATQVLTWITLAGTLLGGFILLEDRHANAGETAALFVQQSKYQAIVSNDARLERLRRELRYIRLRQTNGTVYPEDSGLISDLQPEISISMTCRNQLRNPGGVTK